MQKLEVALNIIEEKLASIPGLTEAYAKKVGSANSNEKSPAENAPTQPSSNTNEAEKVPQAAEVSEPEPVQENFVAVKDDPRYARFIKMMNVGVPVPAVEGKMRLEGLDPALLHTPDAPLPDGGTAAVDDSSDSDSLSSFSESD